MVAYPGRLLLGRDYDFIKGGPGQSEVLLTARTLTEHALCLGGTRAARTELALVLLEETLLQGIPCIAVDASGFTEPLAACLQEGKQPSTPLQERAHIDVYSPGSAAGTPINLLPSFRPPPSGALRRSQQADDLREQLEYLISALLALTTTGGELPTERDRALLQLVLEPAWRAEVPLTPALLVRQLQDPPVRRLGTTDLDALCSPTERAKLTLALSHALSQPLFAEWGEIATPLEMARLIAPKPVQGRPIGKTRAVVFRVEALNLNERGCFVTLLLSAALSWARAQTGAPVLRLLIYLDEAATQALLHTIATVRHSPAQALTNTRRPTGVGLVMSAEASDSLHAVQTLRANTWLVGQLVEGDLRRQITALLARLGGFSDVGYLDETLSSLSDGAFLLHNKSSAGKYVYLRAPACRADSKAGT
ncbi:MAG: hypothetical protein NZL91_09910 [Thermoflexales bacterium]|nr:hypothetical protein [Thermoflexales bacterium]